MYYVMAINLILLVDLVLHLFFYGPKAILKLKKEFILEGILQVSFLLLTICYFTADAEKISK